MGIYEYTDDQTGKLYRFEYGGETPTDQDFAEMEQYISSDRDRLNQTSMFYRGNEIAPEDDSWAFGRGLDVGATSSYSALGTGIRDVGEATGFGWLEGMGRGMEESARYEQLREATQLPEMTRWADVDGIGDFFTFAGEAAGQSAPEMAATLGAAGAATLLAPAGAVVAPLAASAGVALPFFYGRNIERQEDAVDAGTLESKNRLNAFLAAGGQAALNSIGDKLLLSGKLLGLNVTPGKALLTRVVQYGAAGAATEVPTEVTQQILERAQAGLPLDNDEAMSEYLEAAVAAGILGAGFGGASGPFRGRGTSRSTEDEEPQAPAADDDAATMEDAMGQIGLGDPQTALTGDINQQTLEELGVPKGAPIWKALGNLETLDERLEALEDYGIAAAKSPGTREIASKVENFLTDFRRNRSQTEARAPAGNEAEAMELAAGEAQRRAAAQVTKEAPSETQADSGVEAQTQENTQPDLPEQPPAPKATLRDIWLSKAREQVDNYVRAQPQMDAPEEVRVDAARRIVDDQETVEEAMYAALVRYDAAMEAAEETASENDNSAVEPPAQEEPVQTEEDGEGVADAELKDRIDQGLDAEDEGPIGPVDGPSSTKATAAEQSAILADVGRRGSEAAPGPVISGAPTSLMDRVKAHGRVLKTQRATEGPPRNVREFGETAEDRMAAAVARNAGENFRSQEEIVRNAALGRKLREGFFAREGVTEEAFRRKHGDVRDNSSPADKQVVLDFLESKKNRKESGLKASRPEDAALSYFRLFPDVQSALEAMAYDSVLGEDKASFRGISDPWLKRVLARSSNSWGLSAKEWVDQNMPEGKLLLEKEIAFRKREARDQLLKIAMSKKPKTKGEQRKLDALLSTSARRADAQMESDRSYWEDLFAGEDRTATKRSEPVAPVRPKDVLGRASETSAEGKRKVSLPKAPPILDFLITNEEYGMAATVHPAVERLLRNNNLSDALPLMMGMSKSPVNRAIMEKLIPLVKGVRVIVASEADMNAIAEVYGGYKMGPTEKLRGLYAPRLLSQEDRARLDPETLELYDSIYANSIVVDEAALNEYFIVHELIHAATDRILSNPSHPLTKKLDGLFKHLKQHIPDSVYGMENVKEMVAEGMTNPAFIRQLSHIDMGETTAAQRFLTAIKNWLRSLIGKGPAPKRTAKTDLDELFDRLVAPAVETPLAGPVDTASTLSALKTPKGTIEVANRFKDKFVEATPSNMEELSETIRSLPNTDTAGKLKDLLMRGAMPLRFITEKAERYLPSARKTQKLVQEHASRQHAYMQRVDATVKRISRWLKSEPSKVADFNRLRFLSTEYEVDFRDNSDKYEKVIVEYKVNDADGDPVRTEQKLFNTYEDALKFTAPHNAKLNGYAKGTPLPTSIARVVHDPTGGHSDGDLVVRSKDRLRAHNEVKRLYRTFSAEGKTALNEAFEIPEFFRKEMQKLLSKRVESMVNGDKNLHKKIYEKLYNKIFAESLIDPYQALQRVGDYGLSYIAIDPLTGTDRVYKHSFLTNKGRTEAHRRLAELAAAEAEMPVEERSSNIRQIMPYAVDHTPKAQKVPSLQFVDKILGSIEKEGGLASSALKEDVLLTFFQMTPETSFLSSFRKRKGVAGYEGGISPIEQEMGHGDTIANINRNAVSLASKTADIEFRTAFSELNGTLDAELEEFTQRNAVANAADPELANREADTASRYRKVLDEYASAPFNKRAEWSRNVTAGTYMFNLGFNPSSAAITLFHFPTIVAPYLGAKYGMRQAVKAIGMANRILFSTGGKRVVERIDERGGLTMEKEKVGVADYSLSNLDFSEPENQYLQALVTEGDRLGMFNRSHNQEIIAENLSKGIIQKMAAYSGLLQHHFERYVRESTLASTYLMELYKAMPEARGRTFEEFVSALQRKDNPLRVPDDIAQQAARVATDTTDITNGSILAAESTLWSQGDFGSIIFLFKRFPLSMMNLMAHTLERTFKANNASAEDRRIAKMQLAGMMGSFATLAGAAGLPMYGMVAGIYDALFQDEDEPDFDTMVRTGFLGEAGYSGLASYLLGVDVGPRIGLSGWLYRDDFLRESDPLAWQIIEGLAGPAVGMLRKVDHTGYFVGEGDWWRATETSLPSFMANAMRGIRYYTEGVRTTRHDPLVDDVGVGGALAKSFGFTPVEVSQQMAINNAVRRIDNNINNRSRKLLQRLNRARAEGDSQTYRETLRDIQEFDRKHPQVRIFDSIERSRKAFESNSARMHNGLLYSRKNEPLLRELAESYTNPSVWSSG